MIRTVAVKLKSSRFYAVVYDGTRYILSGPTRDSRKEARSEALRFYREGAHLPRRMRDEERVTYSACPEVKTVSSMIRGKSAAAYWGGYST